jgi:signal transduction histidine kinase
MTVADTGTGIHPEVRKKMFEPFFTTKGHSGTGLGLPVSLEIVGRHKGSLRVRSRQGKRGSGTVFALFLPFEAAGEGKAVSAR